MLRAYIDESGASLDLWYSSEEIRNVHRIDNMGPQEPEVYWVRGREITFRPHHNT